MWTSALTDLRLKLADGSTDKPRYNKKVFGKIDGSNLRFKTFESRRLTDFTQDNSPFGVYLDGDLIPASSVFEDDLISGYFKLRSAPVDGQEIECSYYFQWFTDEDLKTFLKLGSEWVLQISDYTQLTEGLRPSALAYSAAEAYQKLALRWVMNTSEQFRLEDAPDTNKKTLAEQYQKMAESLRKEAILLRDDFYTRSGRSKQPIARFARGRARDVAPRR